MRIDQLKTGNIDRATTGQLQYQMVRGRLSELIFINTTTWHFKDRITIKLRHEGGVKTIVDRVSALRLACLCDLKKGMTTTGTPDYVGDENGNNPERNGFVSYNQGVRYFVNAFTLPVGHITLTGAQQLEITVETAAQDKQPDPNNQGQFLDQPKGVIKISSVQYKTRVDTLLTYDVSNDLEAQQGGIREIFLCGKNNVSLFHTDPAAAGYVYGVPVPFDITVKLGVDGDDSENELEAYAAMTAINGQLNFQPSNLIRVFQDLESVPASTYIKVFGENADMTEILYIREDSIPHMVSASISSAIDSEQKRIEHLEQNDPARAKALQQTGAIATSEALAVAKDNFVPAVSAPSK